MADLLHEYEFGNTLSRLPVGPLHNEVKSILRLHDAALRDKLSMANELLRHCLLYLESGDFSNGVTDQEGGLMSDLHDERIRELEEIIVAMPQITYRFETHNYLGSEEPLMPEDDIRAACSWLHRVNMEHHAILAKRS